MTKIAIVLGRGTEGCGVTQCAIQMQKVTKADIYSAGDKRWGRAKGLDIRQKEFMMADEWEKTADELNNKYDLVIIYSVPSKSHPQGCQDNFVPFLKSSCYSLVF